MYGPPPPPQAHTIARASSNSHSTADPGRQPSPTTLFGDQKIESDERLFTSQHEANKTGSDDGPTDSVEPLPTNMSKSRGAHHRKLSSFSSINGLMGSSIYSPGGDGGEHPLKSGPHHRNTSSTVSFLQGLDVLEGSDVMFLRNLHNSTPHYGGPTPVTQSSSQPIASGPPPLQDMPQPLMPASHGNSSSHPPVYDSVHMQSHSPQSSDDLREGSKLASGGTSKRIRRKCTVGDCPNRVVQGGLCISHGAKRKTCKHPGCTKNVKKAGLCSTHGPARRRCDADGCNKVAVQGGKCIAHGAKKKMCCVDNCNKQAILSGMCKKHHDKCGGMDPNAQPMCIAIENKNPSHTTEHARGLSIFQDLSADAVQNLLGDDPLPL